MSFEKILQKYQHKEFNQITSEELSSITKDIQFEVAILTNKLYKLQMKSDKLEEIIKEWINK